MASGKKKLDEYHLKILRELVSLPSNKQCFDCHQRGPTYVNVTIGSFVCTTCSGMLRGLTPPHRVKSISMATFTPDEIDFVKARGNEYCRRVWLGLCDTDQPTKDEQQIKDFMISKYERKRYYLNPSTNPTANGNGSGSLSPNNTPAPSTPLSSTKPSSNGTSAVTTNNAVSSNIVHRVHSTIVHPTTTFQLKPPSTSNRANSNLTSGQQVLAVNGTNNSNNDTNHNNNVFTPDQLFQADFSKATTDPFSSSNSNSQFGSVPPQPNFANFDNNPIFNSSSTGFAGVTSSNCEPSEDRYAALKDLDCERKSQQQQQQQFQSNAQTTTAGLDWGTNGGVGIGVWPSNTANLFNSTAQGGDTNTVTSNPFTGESVWPNSNNSFGGNPFRNARGIQDNVWCAVPNGQLANGFPTSQSLNFASKGTWNNDPISNPFTVGPSAHTTGHHSSNPFL